MPRKEAKVRAGPALALRERKRGAPSLRAGLQGAASHRSRLAARGTYVEVDVGGAAANGRRGSFACASEVSPVPGWVCATELAKYLQSGPRSVFEGAGEQILGTLDELFQMAFAVEALRVQFADVFGA